MEKRMNASDLTLSPIEGIKSFNCLTHYSLTIFNVRRYHIIMPFFISLLGPRLLRVSHPTQHIQSIVISSRGYVLPSALRSRRSFPHHQQTIRFLTPATSLRTPRSFIPSKTDRGPISEEDTQTEFSSLDVLAHSPPPTTAVDACLNDGFHLGNGVKIRGGSGCLLVGGEAFEWRPWEVTTQRSPMVNGKGQWDVAKEAWALLEMVWPRPGGWNILPHVTFPASS